MRLDHRAVLRESVASALSQPVASVLTIIIVSSMMVTALLTTGRTVAAEQRIIETLDAVGSRAIVVRADPSAGLTADALQNLDALADVEWFGGFAASRDASSTANPDGARVAVRVAYGSRWSEHGLPDAAPTTLSAQEPSAYASKAAVDALGMVDGAGSVTTVDGLHYGIGGELQTPEFLAGMEPLVLVPGSDDNATLVLLIVIAERSEAITSVTNGVRAVLAVDDPSLVSVDNAESVAQLRQVIQGQFGAFGRELMLLLLAVSAVLVAVVLGGLALIRRKDFGRRRALGASRSLIVALVMYQALALSLLGAVLGAAAAVAVLVAGGNRLPGPSFIVATAVLAVAAATLAAVIPGLVASRRDPIKELRTP